MQEEARKQGTHALTDHVWKEVFSWEPLANGECESNGWVQVRAADLSEEEDHGSDRKAEGECDPESVDDLVFLTDDNRSGTQQDQYERSGQLSGIVLQGGHRRVIERVY